MSGPVRLVGAGPGPADLITLRGYRALQAATVVLFDALVDADLLDGLPARRVYVGKRCGCHGMTQDEINALLVRLALDGEQVVRLKGGDPTVLGRAGEEALACVEAGVPFDIVPGVTSSVAAPSFAGIPVTHRGVADGFAVVTAHKQREGAFFSIPSYQPKLTVILLMGVGTVDLWQDQLLDRGYPAETPVAFVTDGTTDQQRVVVTTVGGCVEAAREEAVGTPSVAVVGDVVRLRGRLAWHHTDQAPLAAVVG